MNFISSPRPGSTRNICVHTSQILCSTYSDAQHGLAVRRVRVERSASPVILRFRALDADSVWICLKPVAGCGSAGSASMAREVVGCALRSLRHGATLRCDGPVDLVSFILPAATLSRWAEDSGVRNFSGLDYASGTPLADEVIANFALAVLPSLDAPSTASRLFVDYVLHAVCTHVARTFGRVGVREIKGGLAPWQERRAKEMMSDWRQTNVSLSRLAEECRLSVCHFAKAFRQTTGETPYQWHLRHRIDRAMELLSGTHLSLADIAARCGFSDQSHFTRAFSKKAGVSPGAWRKWSDALGKTSASEPIIQANVHV